MNILVVRNDKLGDFITALPAIYVLKKYKPDNKIIVLISELNRAIAQECDFIDDIIIDKNETVFELSRLIKNKRIDVSITLFSNNRVAVAQLLAQISHRIAPATKLAQFLYTTRVVQRRSQVKMSEFEYNLDLTKTLFNDINLDYRQPLLQLIDSDEVYNNFSNEFGIDKEIIVFHMGHGGSADANWEIDEYLILIQAIIDKNKFQVVLTFGPDEIDLYQKVKEKVKHTSAICYQSTQGLISFAKIIKHCRLFISASTGTFHLASLIGARTLTFFADSLFASAKRWRGVGDISFQEHYTIPTDVIEREKRLLYLVNKLSSL
ncbi:MAG: glycosyltransferase family 9 protein [Gammaproteobacteria bacterium]|nr:glycosyltransferase family 9 protein [Gammaproteobacteria bacterium]